MCTHPLESSGVDAGARATGTLSKIGQLEDALVYPTDTRKGRRGVHHWAISMWPDLVPVCYNRGTSWDTRSGKLIGTSITIVVAGYSR